MKFIYLFVCFLAMAGTSFAQKTKTVEIWKNVLKIESLDANFNYDKNDSLRSISIQLIAADHKYPSLAEAITIYIGTPNGFYKF